MTDHAQTRLKPAPAQRHAREGNVRALAGPTAETLRATAHLLNAAPDKVAQRALADQLSAPAQRVEAPRPNRTGLPSQLKAGIESLSGISMDDVRVHRNSSAPAQLNAHAYAQGTDIHVAPGQDHHLPHEAWHVVQQKQGRVKATMQMKAGVPVNDDAGLEHEADRMGAKALSAGHGAPHQLAEARTPGRAPVQRRTTYYGNGEGLEKAIRKQVRFLVTRLDREVARATDILSRDPTLSAERTFARMGYVKPWVTAFNKLTRTGQIPEFFYARYGYAVEAIASAAMPRKYQDLTVQTQYTAGATRPDFVIWHGKDQVAWLDITAAASAGHIRNKQHSGWSTRPVVAEVLYNSPGVNSFSKKGLTQEQKQSLKNITLKAQQDEEDFETGEEHLSIVVEEAITKAAGPKGSLSKTALRKIITAAIKEAVSPIQKDTVNITNRFAAQVLRCLSTIRIRKTVDTGANWASWAYPKMGGYKQGREIVIALGGYLRGRRFDVPDHLDVL